MDVRTYVQEEKGYLTLCLRALQQNYLLATVSAAIKEQLNPVRQTAACTSCSRPAAAVGATQ